MKEAKAVCRQEVVPVKELGEEEENDDVRVYLRD